MTLKQNQNAASDDNLDSDSKNKKITNNSAINRQLMFNIQQKSRLQIPPVPEPQAQDSGETITCITKKLHNLMRGFV